MTAWLAAILLAGQAAAPVPFELAQFVDRSAALDGRLVEFDAYVILMQRPGGPPTLAARDNVDLGSHATRGIGAR